MTVPPPFDPSHYTQHVPEIENRIRELDPHVIVAGLGPSAWMLRYVDQELLRPIRLWGVNDFFKIMPCHDLTIMDHPIRELHPAGDRYKTVVASKPERWWIYSRCFQVWSMLKGEKRQFDLKLWTPGSKPHKQPKLQEKPHHHTIASPVSTLSIAWAEGLRRIGLIGVDLLDGQHRLSSHHKWLDHFIGCFGRQAAELGGQIVNLSPFSKIGSIQPCKTEQSMCGSAPTSGSTQPAPS